jgi:3-hydroxyacyl-CoA dehydrogenase
VILFPPDLTDEDKRKGLTEKSREGRNNLSAKGLDAVLKSRPVSFYTKKNASIIKIGNFEDNPTWLSAMDWVIEVVIENLKIKQELFGHHFNW